LSESVSSIVHLQQLIAWSIPEKMARLFFVIP
jgi:hypothetical protein